MGKSNNAFSGCGTWVCLCTFVLVILKAVGVLPWSWWWVFSPVLICLGIIFVLYFLLGFVTEIVRLMK